MTKYRINRFLVVMHVSPELTLVKYLCFSCISSVDVSCLYDSLLQIHRSLINQAYRNPKVTAWINIFLEEKTFKDFWIVIMDCKSGEEESWIDFLWDLWDKIQMR